MRLLALAILILTLGVAGMQMLVEDGSGARAQAPLALQADEGY